MVDNLWFWVGFNVFVLCLLALDLGVFHRKAHAVGVKEAAAWSLFWIALALSFNAGLYFFEGPEIALQFLTGYLIEKSLSVDNIFIFVLIFSAFGVPPAYHHRVLFWGILSALVMRGIMIAIGSYLVSQFHWVLYFFGAFLIVTGIKMALQKDRRADPTHNVVVRVARQFIPLTRQYHGARFLVRENGRLVATPLVLVLLTVEVTDLVFAIDSIPAVFAVTQDPFIVYTSNVFAILGLRALYFLLAGAIGQFRYLKVALAAILVLVGGKMLVADVYKVPTSLSLGIIAAVLAVSVAASLLFPKPEPEDW